MAVAEALAALSPLPPGEDFAWARFRPELIREADAFVQSIRDKVKEQPDGRFQVERGDEWNYEISGSEHWEFVNDARREIQQRTGRSHVDLFMHGKIQRLLEHTYKDVTFYASMDWDDSIQKLYTRAWISFFQYSIPLKLGGDGRLSEHLLMQYDAKFTYAMQNARTQQLPGASSSIVEAMEIFRIDIWFVINIDQASKPALVKAQWAQQTRQRFRNELPLLSVHVLNATGWFLWRETEVHPHATEYKVYRALLKIFRDYVRPRMELLCAQHANLARKMVLEKGIPQALVTHTLQRHMVGGANGAVRSIADQMGTLELRPRWTAEDHAREARRQTLFAQRRRAEEQANEEPRAKKRGI